MQIEVVRHDGSTQDTDRDVKHLPVTKKRRGGKKASGDAGKIGLDQQDFHQVTDPDGSNQYYHNRFQVTKPAMLQVQYGEHVERCKAHADQQGNMKQQIEGNG